MKYKFAILFIFFTFSFSDLEIRTPGDINNDGVIDILDLVELVSIILGNSNNIENADFMESPPKKFFRLTKGGEVRLMHAYYITCNKVIKNNNL